MVFSREALIYVADVEARPDDSRFRLASLTDGCASVLDVGCAVGYIGRYLRKARPNTWLAGIEIDARAAEQARPHYDQVIAGSIEDPAVWAELQRPVDAMIFGDVLEHTADPIEVLQLAKRKLQPGGRLVVSIPNIAFVKIRLRLLRGRFEYEDWGIMDRTHLRFFTNRTAKAMLQAAGFRVTQEESIHSYPVPAELRGLSRLRFVAWREAKAPLARVWPTLFAQQFIMVAQPQ